MVDEIGEKKMLVTKKHFAKNPLIHLLIPVPAVTVLFIGLFPTNAHAYLDPGTGSLILQVILGGIAGVFAIFKLYGEKIKSFFSKTKDKE